MVSLPIKSASNEIWVHLRERRKTFIPSTVNPIGPTYHKKVVETVETPFLMIDFLLCIAVKVSSSIFTNSIYIEID